MTLEVVRPGVLATVQDLGRPGWGHLGVPRSGAADRASLRRANELVGNAADAAGLEVLLGGLRLIAHASVTVAVTGAVCDVSLEDVVVERNAALTLAAGSTLRLGAPRAGVRSYVAVRGGIDVPPVLGSRSYDQLGAIGPAPLSKGQVLALGDAAIGPALSEVVAAEEPARDVELRFLVGPRDAWLEPDGLEMLTATAWSVSPQSDRTGVRLSGPVVPRRPGELASEGLVPGSIQLPVDGQPILLGPDAGVTGGYPVVGVVIDADRDRIGQLAPGATVRLRCIG